MEVGRTGASFPGLRGPSRCMAPPGHAPTLPGLRPIVASDTDGVTRPVEARIGEAKGALPQRPSGDGLGFPLPVQDGCDPRGSRPGTRGVDGSDEPRPERRRDPAVPYAGFR